VVRALVAFSVVATILVSYAVQWVLTLLFGPARMAARLERVHEANAERLTNGFTRLRGVFIKMGQVLSVLGGFLPRAYGSALTRLQDDVPPRPFHEIEPRLENALGPDALAKFETLEREPIAAASLAQVHRGVTRDGRPVAVKVLYPGIETLIRRDLAVLRALLPLLRLLLPISRFERVLDQLSAMLARETDYRQERRNIERIRGIFAERDDIVVPRVLDELTADGVLTMTFEDGIKVTDFEEMERAGIDREAVARLLVESYYSMLLEHHVFHADPHPGNFLVRPGPKLVILDFGAVEEVTPSLAEGMQGVVMGAISRDADQVLAGLERMGFVAEGGDRELLRRVGREYLRALANVQITDYSNVNREAVEKLVGFDQVRGRLRDIMKHVEYPEGYFYVERTLVLLFGLVGQLAPKTGLPGIAAPVASQAMLRAFAARARSAPESDAPLST
jgi:predicted unusual protein kinase regulating ubiquinone biosynthesis (AarF/ABC1/UbiB family)